MTAWLMSCRMDVVLPGMKIPLTSLSISTSALGCPDVVWMNSHILKVIFFWAVDLNSGLKMFSKVCCPEKAIATHSSTLAWRIPWTEEPGGLQSMGSLRVGHDWATSVWLFTFMHWRRKWQPTPVFLPGESQGQGSLVGCHLGGRTESDTTEVT